MIKGVCTMIDTDEGNIRVRIGRAGQDLRSVAAGYRVVVMGQEEYERLTAMPRTTVTLGNVRSTQLCPECRERLHALKPGEWMALCEKCSAWKVQA